MTDPAGDWSARANFWRGDRALGGRLHVRAGRLVFVPHGLERALGGDDGFDVALAEILGLGAAPRSMRVPRRRLVVTTSPGRTGYFLVNRLDAALDHLRDEITEAGGTARALDDTETRSSVPELSPDDSLLMNVIQSGWAHLVGLAIWGLALVGVLAGSRNPWAVAVLVLLVLFSGWRAWAGFRRRSRIKAARRRRDTS